MNTLQKQSYLPGATGTEIGPLLTGVFLGGTVGGTDGA